MLVQTTDIQKKKKSIVDWMSMERVVPEMGLDI